MIEQGRQIGKYRLLAELGRGGFATVYRALDSQLEREVALKVLHPALLIDRAFVERFFREARTLARLRHPHIVTIHEMGEADGRVFLAMELAADSLAAQIAERGPRRWADVRTLLEPVAAALDYAHAAGVVHRDLKPANILIAEGGRPLLSDFGFARALGESNASFSASGGILGTPSYIAPEIWDGQRAGVPADSYALACIVFELLTGGVLFAGETPLKAVAAHAAGPQLPASWPAETTAVFRKALARDPAVRYQSAGAFVAALTDAGRSRPQAVAPLPEAPPLASAREPLPTPLPPAAALGAAREPAASLPPLASLVPERLISSFNTATDRPPPSGGPWRAAWKTALGVGLGAIIVNSAYYSFTALLIGFTLAGLGIAPGLYTTLPARSWRQPLVGAAVGITAVLVPFGLAFSTSYNTIPSPIIQVMAQQGADGYAQAP